MLPVLLPLHFRDLGAPDSLIGFVAGVYTIATLFMRPIIGVVVDRFGRKGVLSLGLLIMGLASIAFAVFPVVSLVLIVRFVQGLGWGMANTASPTLASDVIPKSRFAEGMGWFTQGNAIASVIAPGVSLMLYYSIGAQASVLVSAGFFVLAFICSRFVEGGTRADLEAMRTREGANANVAKGPHKPPRINLKTFIETRSLLAAALMFFVTCCYGSVTSFVPVMTEFRGIEGVVLFFPVEAVTIMVVRPFFGKLIDRIGHRVPAIVGLAGMAASMATLSLASEFPGLMLAAVFNGFGYAICYANFQSMAVAGIEAQRRGSATATFYVGYDGGMGLGAVVAGLVAGALGYGNMYALFAFLPAIALAVLFVVGGRK